MSLSPNITTIDYTDKGYYLKKKMFLLTTQNTYILLTNISINGLSRNNFLKLDLT